MTYTGWMSVKVAADSEAADIPTMREMSSEGYSSYLDGGLFFVDHHDVLRSVHGAYPLATTADQIDLLVAHLLEVKKRMIAGQE